MILGIAHVLGASFAIMALVSAHGVSLGWIGLAAWPYALSYAVARSLLTGSRVGAAVQSALLLLFTTLAIDAWRGHLFGQATSTGFDAMVSVALAVVLVIASGHGLTARRCVDGAGDLDEGQRRRIGVHAALGAIAVTSLALRADLWHVSTADSLGPQIAIAMITAALPFAASAIFSIRTVVTTPWRLQVCAATLACGCACSVGYYGGLFGWRLRPGLDWVTLFALSFVFIVVADWAGDDDAPLS